MLLGKNHLGNIFVEVIIIKTLFALAKPLAAILDPENICRFVELFLKNKVVLTKY